MTRHSEIEVKLRVPDVHTLIAQLRNLGAKRDGRVHERNTLFDTEDSQLRARRAILRIRREQPADSRKPARKRRPPTPGLLTFKARVQGQSGGGAKYKEREEIEYRIKDASRFARLLRRIGMRPWFQYEKYRTKYTAKDGLHIDLDETPIGVFLELEGPKQAIDRAAKALGYSRHDYMTESYFELYREQCSRKGLRVANMVFKQGKKR